MPGTNQRAAYRTKKQRETAAAQSSLVLLTMFDGLISLSFGPECMLLPSERELIEAPLQRILQRVDPTLTNAIEKYTDPLMVAMGLIAWGARVWQIQLAKLREAKAARMAAQPASTPAEGMSATPIESMPDFVPQPPAPGLNLFESVVP